jgi:hypothetical protein
MAERPETLAETRAQLRPSTFAIGAVFVGLFVALAIGDHYVGLHGSLGVRLALWGAVGLAVLALCVGLVQQRRQAARRSATSAGSVRGVAPQARTSPTRPSRRSASHVPFFIVNSLTTPPSLTHCLQQPALPS